MKTSHSLFEYMLVFELRIETFACIHGKKWNRTRFLPHEMLAALRTDTHAHQHTNTEVYG